MTPAIVTQIRVIWALVLREIHTIYGSEKLGYLWVLIQSVFSMILFWSIRAVFKTRSPHGISTLAYLVAGFTLFNIFSDLIGKTMAAISANRAVLTFPQVTPLDIMISRAVVVLVTHFLVAVITLTAGVVYGFNIEITDWGGVMFVLLLTTLLGLGLGMFFAALNVYLPALDKIVPLVVRVMFFVSGIFFSLNAMPLSSTVKNFLELNPMLHLIERSRSYIGFYPAPDTDMYYVTSLTCVFLVAGLLLERHTRRLAITKL